MSKIKAWFVAAAIAVLIAAVIWLMWDYALRSFWIMALIFAMYGFVCFVIHLAGWLEKPTVAPRHAAADKDEEDAALWEDETYMISTASGK